MFALFLFPILTNPGIQIVCLDMMHSLPDTTLEYFELFKKVKSNFEGELQMEKQVQNFLSSYATKRETGNAEMEFISSVVLVNARKNQVQRNKWHVMSAMQLRESGKMQGLLKKFFDFYGVTAKDLPSREMLTKDLKETLSFFEQLESYVQHKEVNLGNGTSFSFIIPDYFRFLELSHENRFAEQKPVPPLCIDLVWRAHMCMPTQYNFLEKYFGTDVFFHVSSLSGNMENQLQTENLFTKKYGHSPLHFLFSKTSNFLPEKDGLRKTVLKEILKNLGAMEAIYCGLVCKEWRKISRSEQVWKEILERDLILWKKTAEVSSGEELGLLEKFEGREGKSFEDYWTLKDKILETRANNQCEEECEISVEPREYEYQEE